jgi:hypothetical protein
MNRPATQPFTSRRSFDFGNRDAADVLRRSRSSNPVPGNRGITNRSIDGSALARYRQAISESQNRVRNLPQGDRPRLTLPSNRGSLGGDLRARRTAGGGDLSSRLAERLRARTSASTPGEGAFARSGTSSVTRRPSSLRSRFGAGAVGGGGDTLRAGTTRRSSLLDRDGGGVASSRLRARGDGFGSSSRSRLSVRHGFSGTGGDAVSVRYIRRHDHDHHHHGHHGHHHGFHDWFGYVHHHRHGGFFVSWWNPWHYSHYHDYWVGGLPAFGFGISYYEPVYAPYFEPGVVVLEPAPVVVQQPVVVGPAAPVPLEGAVPAPVVPAPTAPASPAPVDPAIPSTDENDAAKQAFDTGFRAFSEQRYEQALGMFRLVVELDPNNGEAWLGRAHAAFALGQYREAADSVGRAADLGAFPRGYRFDPRPVYRTPGAFDEALRRLDDYARTNPQDADAHVLLAWLHVGLGERAKAEASLATLRALRADDPTAAFLRVALLPPELPPSAEGEEGGVPVRPPAPGEAPVLPVPPASEDLGR